MAFVPSGEALWVLQGYKPAVGGERISLHVVALQAFKVSGSWPLEWQSGDIFNTSVQASQRAVAVGLSAVRFAVYRLASSLELGALLFTGTSGQRLSFSLDGYFVVSSSHCEVRVLDSASGSCVACGQFMRAGRAQPDCIDQLAWPAGAQHELHVRCTEDAWWTEGLRFRVLRFVG